MTVLSNTLADACDVCDKPTQHYLHLTITHPNGTTIDSAKICVHCWPRTDILTLFDDITPGTFYGLINR